MHDLLYALFLMALPLAEMAVCHFWTHFFLGGNNVVLGVYSRDVYMPIIIGIISGLAVMHARAPFRFRIFPQTASFNAACVAGFTLALFAFGPLSLTLGPWLTTTLVLTLALGALFSSLFIFVSLSEFRERVRGMGWRVGYLIASLVLIVHYAYVLKAFWPWLVRLTGNTVFFTLRLCQVNVTEMRVGGNFILSHPHFKAAIGMGCAGLEGIFFFLFAYSLFLLFQGEGWPRRRVAGVAVVGVCFLYFLNVARIVVFFAVAVIINQTQTLQHGRTFFMWAFHENIGWVLYLWGIFGFLGVLQWLFPPPLIARPRPS